MTSGIVSALEPRDHARPTTRRSKARSRPMPRSTTATRVARCSNLKGQVIGITSQIQSDSGGNDGVGFAIPSNTVRTIVAAADRERQGAARAARRGGEDRDERRRRRRRDRSGRQRRCRRGPEGGDVITAVGRHDRHERGTAPRDHRRAPARRQAVADGVAERLVEDASPPRSGHAARRRLPTPPSARPERSCRRWRSQSRRPCARSRLR